MEKNTEEANYYMAEMKRMEGYGCKGINTLVVRSGKVLRKLNRI